MVECAKDIITLKGMLEVSNRSKIPKFGNNGSLNPYINMQGGSYLYNNEEEEFNFRMYGVDFETKINFLNIESFSKGESKGAVVPVFAGAVVPVFAGDAVRFIKSLKLNSTEVKVSCTCEDFNNNPGFCKHLFHALLNLHDTGYLDKSI